MLFPGLALGYYTPEICVDWKVSGENAPTASTEFSHAAERAAHQPPRARGIRTRQNRGDLVREAVGLHARVGPRCVAVSVQGVQHTVGFLVQNHPQAVVTIRAILRYATAFQRHFYTPLNGYASTACQHTVS